MCINRAPGIRVVLLARFLAEDLEISPASLLEYSLGVHATVVVVPTSTTVQVCLAYVFDVILWFIPIEVRSWH